MCSVSVLKWSVCSFSINQLMMLLNDETTQSNLYNPTDNKSHMI